MNPARFARFRRSRNDTADTALDAIGTPRSDRYSVTSFLTGVRVPLGVPAESIFGGAVSGARKHLIKGAFFLPCFGTRTPRALHAFGTAETTLRTPHWTRSALRAAIAIPSLRSLRGFESLNRRQKTPLLEVFFLALFGDMTPARFARFRHSRNDTADTALDAIGTPCNDRYSVTSFLTGVRVPQQAPFERNRKAVSFFFTVFPRSP